MLGADDVDRAVAFWSAALGYRPVAFPESTDEFTILVPPTGRGTRLAVHRSATPVQERPRVHLDLIAEDGREQRSEIERLLDLGASHTSWEYPNDPDFVVLADTEGNRFCVVDASHAGSSGPGA